MSLRLFYTCLFICIVFVNGHWNPKSVGNDRTNIVIEKLESQLIKRQAATGDEKVSSNIFNNERNFKYRDERAVRYDDVEKKNIELKEDIKPKNLDANLDEVTKNLNDDISTKSRFFTKKPSAKNGKTNMTEKTITTPAIESIDKNTCDESNGRYTVKDKCDEYIECFDGKPVKRLCPDGLVFDPTLPLDIYPCQYKFEVDCANRTEVQPAKTKGECPHRFGFFKGSEVASCGSYINCVDGFPFKMTCPGGLAFNEAENACDWPDRVPDCDVEAFLGFSCANAETPKNTIIGIPIQVTYYKIDIDCRKYFACIDDNPRLLGCDPKKAFDETTGRCENIESVASCPDELRQKEKGA